MKTRGNVLYIYSSPMESQNVVKHQPSKIDTEAVIPSDPQSTRYQYLIAEDLEHPIDGFPVEPGGGTSSQLVVNDDQKQYLKFEPYLPAATSDETSSTTVVVSVSKNVRNE